MKKSNCFDDRLKSAINDNATDVKASRDIFNEAWNKKEQEVSKKRYFNIQCMKKVVMVTACCAAFSLGGALTFSPNVRAEAQKALRTFFALDDSGSIVEKSEDENVPVVASGEILNESNKDKIEKRLGFTINFPEKLDNYSIKKLDEVTPNITSIISVNDVKFKDVDSIKNKLTRAIDDDKIFEELESYDVGMSVCSTYVDNEGHQFTIYLSKYDEDSKMDGAKEINIDDIKFNVKKGTQAKYDTKIIDDRVSETDITSKPTIEEFNSVTWNYDGIRYFMHIGNDSDVDAATQFAEEYIRNLKQN